MILMRLLIFLALTFAIALAGCAPVMDAMVDTVRTTVGRDPGAEPGRLNPNFRYLRVTVGRQVAYVALGNVETRPQGRIEVWYSARREVLRLLNGRIVGAVGLRAEWRDVALPELPSWSNLAAAGEPYRWTRTRDVMPGYRYGVRDALVLRKIAPPTSSALQRIDPKGLTWFEERLEAERVAGPLAWFRGTSDELALPPARYAVDLSPGREIVVYGEQCLAQELCFTWQRWEVKP